MGSKSLIFVAIFIQTSPSIQLIAKHSIGFQEFIPHLKWVGFNGKWGYCKHFTISIHLKLLYFGVVKTKNCFSWWAGSNPSEGLRLLLVFENCLLERFPPMNKGLGSFTLLFKNVVYWFILLVKESMLFDGFVWSTTLNTHMQGRHVFAIISEIGNS